MKEALTARELAVLRCTSEGLTVPATAERLGIAVETVKSHRRHSNAKLGARNASHAVALGYQRAYLHLADAPTSGQFGLLHVKAGALAAKRGCEKRDVIDALLITASRRLNRTITSTTALTRSELSDVIDDCVARLAKEA